MKPNLEISLKFWIALILFFMFWLSFPVYDYIIVGSSIKYIKLFGFLLGALFASLALCVDLLLRHSELKAKLKELENKTKNEGFYRTVSAQTITDYDNQIKCQESKINELKQAFEDAVAEITELRSKNKELQLKYDNTFCELSDSIRLLNQQTAYWRERALHKKHTKKEADSEWWQCVNSVGEYFIKGNKYKQVNNKSGYFYLIGETSITHIVKKSNFKPVK